MSPTSMNTVLRYLRHLVSDTESQVDSDRDLLRRYVSQRDERAFTALLARHGPMTMGVCLRVLGDLHLAEDAFQATFLVLALKAGTIRKCWPAGSTEWPADWLSSSRSKPLAPEPRRRVDKRYCHEILLWMLAGAKSMNFWKRKSSVCLRTIGSRSCCAISKVEPRKKRRHNWAGPSASSRDCWSAVGNACASVCNAGA
jgi:hypothetical protein